MRHLDLFSGIGGFALAARWAFGESHKIIGFCEIDKYCQKLLQKNFGDHIPIHKDIRKLDGTKFQSVELITGGFPCQPFSVAGKQKGKEDDRHLWPEMFRIIQETKPCWIVGENVAGFINMELDESISDLENEGYEVQTFIIPACAVNAPHRRDRVWIVANKQNDSAIIPLSDTNRDGEHIEKYKRRNRFRQTRKEKTFGWNIYEPNWKEKWTEVATRLCRMDDGVSNRVDRLRGLGNAIVPQVAYEILNAIKNIENILTNEK